MSSVFRTRCWKPLHVGSRSTMRQSTGNMSPDGWNRVVQFWLGQYSPQMKRHVHIVLNWPRGLWLFSSRGCILSRYFTRDKKQVALKIQSFIDRNISRERNVPSSEGERRGYLQSSWRHQLCSAIKDSLKRCVTFAIGFVTMCAICNREKTFTN